MGHHRPTVSAGESARTWLTTPARCVSERWRVRMAWSVRKSR